MSRIKSTYKIPMSINLSRWDTPISLKSGSVGIKPLTYKVIIIIAATFLTWMATFIYMLKHDFGLLYSILFTIGYVMLCRISLKREKTGEFGYTTFIPTYRYWVDSRKRFVQTRGTADSKEVAKLKWEIPIEDIDEESGITEFTNGDVGCVLSIVGNGSQALFIDEKEKIIVAFERFLQELKLDVSVTVESKQSRQDCSEQIRNLDYLKRKNADPEVDQIISERIDILENVIQKRFKSTQQYIHLRAPNIDRLNECLENLKRQRGEGMLRYIQPLTGEKQNDRYKEFFSLS